MLISIILPSFNESAAIIKTIEAIEESCGQAGLAIEIIVVDDRSTDDTTRIVQEHARASPWVRLIENPANRGKGYSIRQGLAAAGGDYVFFMDSDATYHPPEFPRFIERLEAGHDLVIGSRRLPRSRFVLGVASFPYIYYRHLQGMLFNAYVKRLTGLDFDDTQCGFKAMTRGFAGEVLARATLDGFSFDVELLVIARRLKARIAEVPVTLNYDDEIDTRMGLGAVARAVLDVRGIGKV